MPACPAPHMTAALLYRSHAEINFRHLATTLNLILEPTGLRFRLIHERPGAMAILSCSQLHVTVLASDAPLCDADLATLLEPYHTKPIPAHLERALTRHLATVELSVGPGPLPDSVPQDTSACEQLLPLLTHMVTNHLLNARPADAVYWGDSNELMSPRAFLEMINGIEDPALELSPDQKIAMETEPQGAPLSAAAGPGGPSHPSFLSSHLSGAGTRANAPTARPAQSRLRQTAIAAGMAAIVALAADFLSQSEQQTTVITSQGETQNAQL